MRQKAFGHTFASGGGFRRLGADAMTAEMRDQCGSARSFMHMSLPKWVDGEHRYPLRGLKERHCVPDSTRRLAATVPTTIVP
jgi:hypothetical protein